MVKIRKPITVNAKESDDDYYVKFTNETVHEISQISNRPVVFIEYDEKRNIVGVLIKK